MTDTPTLTGRDIGQAEIAVRAVLDAFLAEADTTFLQWVALNALATGGSVAQKDRLVSQVSGALRVSDTTVLATPDELDVLGLVSLTAGDQARIELTAAGDARFRLLRTGIDRITERLYRDVPVDDLATARRVLVLVTERANAELTR